MFSFSTIFSENFIYVHIVNRIVITISVTTAVKAEESPAISAAVITLLRPLDPVILCR